MASCSAAVAGASTPGGAAPKVSLATWNMGIPGEHSFSRKNNIAVILETSADYLFQMLDVVDFVAMNELHPAHHANLNKRLAESYPDIAFMGFKQGDAIAWCPKQHHSSTRVMPLLCSMSLL